jgi:sulfatase modifying factor 1
MTAGMFERRIFHPSLSACAALGLAAILLAACEREEKTAQKQAQEQVTCETTSQAISQKIELAAGSFTMGAHPAYREEGPPRAIKVSAFDIDATEVTNNEFAKFVEATGYVTDAERPQPGFEQPGGVVFRPPTLENPSWWHFVAGANWRTPEGPESAPEDTIKTRPHEPVVQVSFNDARAYAAWAGRRLPNETQWEYAANAGADTQYVWGDERAPDGVEMANTWQGTFPIQNTQADGYAKRSPVGCFAANDFGLYDMIGNVWEWTDTVAAQTQVETVYTIKGGSFLCAPNFCRRYRAAARQAQEAGLPTSHIGFRTVSK